MKITSLVENTTADPRLGKEHGLSLYIEAAGKTLLFDMGQSGLFAQNARTLGLDLDKVDLAVLSHGHYDHGGGLTHFLELNKTAPVYLSRYAFQPHYHGAERYIGLDPALQGCDRLHFVADQQTIAPGLTLYSCNDCTKQWDLGSFGLTMVQEGALLPEDFRHEQYLLIEEEGKRVLISGCSHKGVLDIAQWFQPDVLVGGFHFSGLPLDDILAGYARQLDGMDTEFYTCHCTGCAQYEFMRPYMHRLHYLSTGQSVVL